MRSVFFSPGFFERSPVTDFENTDPAFEFVGLPLIIVRVGCFLYIRIVPLGCIGIVVPDNHIAVQVICMRISVKCAVDDLHRFGTGDLLVGTECVIFVPFDESAGEGFEDVFFCPVTVNVREIGSFTAESSVEGNGNLDKFRTGNGSVRTEGTVFVTVEDACVRQRGNRVVEPVVSGYVGEVVFDCPAGLAAGIGEQTEEDRCSFGTGNVSIGTNGVVRIADDVREVVTGTEKDRKGRTGLSMI